MKTLQFWNSIEKCGLPALVHKDGNIGFCSDSVLLSVGHAYSGAVLGYLMQYGPTDDPQIQWIVAGVMCPIRTFTHWAYIPAVPKKEKE